MRGTAGHKTRRMTAAWLIAGGIALLSAVPAVAADITVSDMLPSDAPTLLPDGPIDQLLDQKATPQPLPDPLPQGLPDPDPQPAGSGGGTPGGSQPGAANAPGGSGSGSDPGAGSGHTTNSNDGPAAGDGSSTDDADATIKRASTLTGSAGTLAANIVDLAGPLSVPLGLMAAAAAALIIATRRPTALRKVDEEGTWGNDGRSHRL